MPMYWWYHDVQLMVCFCKYVTTEVWKMKRFAKEVGRILCSCAYQSFCWCSSLSIDDWCRWFTALLSIGCWDGVFQSEVWCRLKSSSSSVSVLLGFNFLLAASDDDVPLQRVLFVRWLDEHDAMMRLLLFLATSVFLTKDTSEQLE